jgi:hypothetical protein
MIEPPLTEAEIESTYDKLEFTENQKEMGKRLGDSFADSLDLPNLTTRGFIALSCLDWQKKVKMTTAEAETKLPTTADSRIQQTIEIFEIFKKKISRVLRIKNKENLIDSAIEKALKLYIEDYASRPQDTDAPK